MILPKTLDDSDLVKKKSDNLGGLDIDALKNQIKALSPHYQTVTVVRLDPLILP